MGQNHSGPRRAHGPAPTPEQFLAGYPSDVRNIANQLRTLIKGAVPAVDESVYAGWRLIGYKVVVGRHRTYFCFVAPFWDRVALGFEFGVLLGDPHRLLRGEGSQVRHLTVACVEDIRPTEFGALIEAAAKLAQTTRSNAIRGDGIK